MLEFVGYCIGVAIIGGGFALVCLALRWLLTKMGAPGAGEPEEEISIVDPNYELMTGLPGLFDIHDRPFEK